MLLDSVYGADTPIPDHVQALLAKVDLDRERFFLHAASLEIPRFDISVSAPEPAFWGDILELLEG